MLKNPTEYPMLAEQRHNTQHLSSSIQTILLVLEFHQILLNPAKSCVLTLADYTANRESHPALKIQLFSCQVNYKLPFLAFQYTLYISETVVHNPVTSPFTVFHNGLIYPTEYAVRHVALGRQGFHLNIQ